MPKLNMNVPHQHTQQEAAERMKKLLDRVKEKYEQQCKDLQEEWLENTLKFSFKTMGFAFKGIVTVAPSEIKFEGEIPFAAMMFKGQIEKSIREAVEKYLA